MLKGCNGHHSTLGMILWDEKLQKMSREDGYDSIFKVPDIIQVFIDRANNELPEEWAARPWTYLRKVSIFHQNTLIYSIPYDMIEDHLVKMLDYIHEKVKEYED